MRVRPILGNRQRLDGGAMYGNAPRALWDRWSPPDERHRIELACRAMLVETDDGRRVLCEAGIGVFFAPEARDRFGVVEPDHRLLANLAADVPVAGVLPFVSPGSLVPDGEGAGARRGSFLIALYVNGASVTSQRLKDGDEVRVGGSRFTYHGP